MLIRHISNSIFRICVNKNLLIRQFSTITTKYKMGDDSGVPLATIVEKLEAFAPSKSAESWDNVGLLIDTINPPLIKKVLLTNDLTETVMQEAVDLKVGMIISYHPPIFKGMKAIKSENWKDRVVIQCLKHSIALFSPHTSWDIVKGGVNDWLADCFPVKSSEPLTETGAGRFIQLSEQLSVKNAIDLIKKHTGVSHVKLALAVGKDIDSDISNVALCAGSGTSVLGNIAADLYLTGEMFHHDVLDAAHRGTHVILCGHSNTERGFLNVFAPQLKTMLPSIDVYISKTDADPLITI